MSASDVAKELSTLIKAKRKPKLSRVLFFEDLETGERWVHSTNDWILNFIPFNCSIHPTLLEPGQEVRVKDVNGHMVRIKCERVNPNEGVLK